MRGQTCVRVYLLPILLWPFFLVIGILLLPIVFLVLIFRGTEYLIYHALYDARLLPPEDIVWTMGTRENQLLINCCLVVDGVLPINDFRRLIDETLIKFQDEDGKLHYWKITKRIHPGFYNYYWIDDDSFDIQEHVYELEIDRVQTEEQLHDVISQHRSRFLSFKNKSSPWEFVLIPYQVGNQHKTVIFARLSHAIADGSALAYFLIHQLGRYEDGSTEDPIFKFSQVRKGFTSVDRFLIHLKGFWMMPVVQASLLFSFKDSNALHADKATGTKSNTWMKPIDLDVVKGIKNRLGCTVNDVLLGCLAKTLSDYYTDMNVECPSEVSLLFPLDIRSSPDEAKEFHNKLAVVILKLPTKRTDLITSIQKTKSRMNYVKTSGEPIGSALGWQLVSFLVPRCLAKCFVSLTVNKTSGSVSNLIGPHRTIEVGNHRVENVVFWPPQTLNHCFGAAFCSYNGRVVMGIEGDHATLKNPTRIAQLFEENINKLSSVPRENNEMEGVMKVPVASVDNPVFELVENT